MKFGSVCSGIEAASVAWHQLGWKAAWLAEIEAAPSAVLAHHYPNVPNLGDMTKLAGMVERDEIEAPDVLVGGTPCQAFSVAGARKGLADERGLLTIKFLDLANVIDSKRIAAGLEPCIITWENVPGVLSSKDNAFGCFLAGLAGESEPLVAPGGKWSNSGYVSGPERAIAWRILDAQYFGVAQRRRRVFVVASARKGFDPAAVLFESEGVRRDIAPSRESGKAVAALTANGVGTCGADDNQGQAGHLIPAAFRMVAFGEYSDDGTASTMKARDYKDATDLAVHSIHGTRDPIVANNIAPCQTVADRHGVAYGMQVRRLTPTECERLQGFPDGYTLVPVGKKMMADGPRYKALGNSMAVPCMAWIGKRIALQVMAAPVEIKKEEKPTMNRDAYRTPPELFAALDAEFDFQLDVAASAENALCKLFIDEVTDSLQERWYSHLNRGDYSWCNPPYSDITPWVKKAAKESKLGIGCVMLVMADTSVGWYAEAIKTCQEVRFIVGGRISFLDPETGKPAAGNNKGSMFLIWHPFGRTAPMVSHVQRDELMAKGRKYLELEIAA